MTPRACPAIPAAGEPATPAATPTAPGERAIVLDLAHISKRYAGVPALSEIGRASCRERVSLNV